MSDTASKEKNVGFTDLHKFFAVLAAVITFAGAALGVLGVLVGVLWGYFSLQRDTAQNKADITEIRAANVQLVKQITDGQEKETALITALAKQLNDRVDNERAVIDQINQNGTNYGKGVVNTRMAEIAEIREREVQMEKGFGDFRALIEPKITTMADHVEQMWGDYMSRREYPPAHIDPRKYSKN